MIAYPVAREICLTKTSCFYRFGTDLQWKPYLVGSRLNLEMVFRTGIVIEIWKTLNPSLVYFSCKRNSPLKSPPDISMQTILTSLRSTLFTGVNDHPTHDKSTDRNLEDSTS
jgi:hypothetical protein